MEAKKIKRGNWYNTTHGYGRCESVDGTRVEMTITGPMPLGRRYIKPRDVKEEIQPPTKPVQS